MVMGGGRMECTSIFVFTIFSTTNFKICKAKEQSKTNHCRGAVGDQLSRSENWKNKEIGGTRTNSLAKTFCTFLSF